MKNVIYLSIIAALFFCSCQSNSFLSQRYTHYGHNSKKSAPQKTTAREQEEPVTIASVETPVNSITEETIASEPSAHYTKPVEEAAAEKVNGSGYAPVGDAAVASGKGLQGFSVKSIAGTVKTVSHQALKAAQKQQAKAAHRGLIFGIINLALFIVICVLIVAGVIFLLTLAAA